MSTAVTTQAQFTPEQMKLITDTVAKGATPDEMKLFLYRCQHMGFDPLKPGQIHFVKYGTGPGTIVVGIEGFRLKAARSGKLAGIKRGAIRDDKGQCIGAWAEVYRHDWKEPAREEVPLSEYFKPGRNGKESNWDKMPETMIKKVAEAAALRMAFPDDLGGIYTDSEMDQARESQGDPLKHGGVQQPGPEDGFDDGTYKIEVPGEYYLKPLKVVPRDELAAAIVMYEKKLADPKSRIVRREKYETFVREASAYLGKTELQEIEEMRAR